MSSPLTKIKTWKLTNFATTSGANWASFLLLPPWKRVTQSLFLPLLECLSFPQPADSVSDRSGWGGERTDAGSKNGPILLSTMASALWADRWLKPTLGGTLMRSSQALLGPSKGTSSSCPLPSQGLVFSKSTPQGCLRDVVPVPMAQGVLWDKDFKRLLPMTVSPGKHMHLTYH